MIVVVGGVSGAGKTTVGKLLADELSIQFHDADDYHPAANIEKMSAGKPLTDTDRQPWLDVLASKLVEWGALGDAVLACSALKAAYRETLASKFDGRIVWIVLYASENVLIERLKARRGHFFEPKLLCSQLETLEVPDDGWLINAEATPREIVSRILDLRALGPVRQR